ncbi:MAG: N-acetylmuramoyl-L-alanine amidase-like domain-containing protein [Gemmatimonadota bacterium]
MTILRWVVAVLGIVAAAIAIIGLPVDSPVGPATAGPSELAEPAEGRWSQADWETFQSTVRWGQVAQIDTLEFGDAVAAVGRRFVGTAYVPGTLEVEGPERVVVSFQGLDCVTFVENALALTRFIRADGARQLPDRPGAEARYESLLAEYRYRSGRLDGYASRLHYFSEWLSDNARRGLLTDLGPTLGAVPDPEAIDFMSSHPDAYPQLADPANLERIRAAERRLNAMERRYMPEDRIAEVADLIRDGDVIAATSTVPGLDIAHTGLALWVDGALHLLHAPLVGEAVEISELPLADRIVRIESQDGIMVARPQER